MKKIPAVFLFLAPVLAVAQPNTLVYHYPRTITVTISAELSIVPDEIYAGMIMKEFMKKGEAQKDLSVLTAEFLCGM